MPNDITIMSSYFLMLLLTILCLSIKEATTLTAYRKFIYQKDLSEYCRRDVIPSVFLGRQVIDANYKILQFSRLEVPYSCLINIRTEKSSNLIVVIQVNHDMNLKNTCTESNAQLVIHEMRQNFGGYWGRIPDIIMKNGPHREDSSYTLKSNTEPPRTTTTGTSSAITTMPMTTHAGVEKSEDEFMEGDYISVELPIVNISSQMLSGKLSPGLAFNYDVTTWKGISYDTQMVPIVEIALKEHNNNRRIDDKEDVDFNSELQVQFNDLFTPDPRLPLPHFNTPSYRRKLYKYQPSVNKRLDFKKNKYILFSAKPTSFDKKVTLTHRRPYPRVISTNPYLPKIHSATTQATIHNIHNNEQQINSWEALHDVLKKLSNNTDVQTKPPHLELANILSEDSSKSVYLMPEISLAPSNSQTMAITSLREASSTNTRTQSIHKTTKFSVSVDTQNRLSASLHSNKSFDKYNALNTNYNTIYNDQADVALLPLPLDVDDIILNVTSQNKDVLEEKLPNATLKTITTSTMITKKSDNVTISLVDHESWENIVKVAPVMVVKLNQTQLTNFTKTSYEVTGKNSSKVRKKRFIHAIDIEAAKPHHLQVKKQVTTTSDSAPLIFQMRKHQQLIEMRDDEISDHVDMQYTGSYIGSPLLSFCTLNITSNRHVHLFNSSRLVFAISNFTLKRMTVVVTTAHTLLDSDERCAPASLECQVSGSRVCIDSLSACDGIPNCGSYDIYDEDRLQCSSTGGARNVCLAAITLLGVLLTVLFIIHYWLKRCVPKVSDAFFIYTEAAENVLYLDTIMRSPHDFGVTKDLNREALQGLEYADIDLEKNSCKRFINRCFIFLRCKRRKPLDETTDMTESFDCLPKLSSFAKIEINKMTSAIPFQPNTSEVAVQTNSCFEMQEFSSAYHEDEFPLEDNIVPSIDSLEIIQTGLSSNQASSELSMLNFFRRKRESSISAQLKSVDVEPVRLSELSSLQENESENQLQYNPDDYKDDENVSALNSVQINNDEYSNEPILRKHLRFHDNVIIIPPSTPDNELDETRENPTNNNNRRSIIFAANKVIQVQNVSNDQNDVDGPSSSAVRELKSYFNWGGAKEKKKKAPKKK